MKRISELMSLKGRIALITGGAGHIGSAMAEALAELGANIVIGTTRKTSKLGVDI